MTDTPLAGEVPVGFSNDPRPSPFLDLLGGLYQRTSVTADRTVVSVGLPAGAMHCNSRGTVHGGVIAALLDVALGRNASVAFDPPSNLVTVSLTTQYIGAARPGQWLQADATVTQRGSALCFAHGTVTAANRLVAEATAVFRVPPQRPSHARTH